MWRIAEQFQTTSTTVNNNTVYTARNAQVVASLLTSCNRLDHKPISRCVRMACDSLLTTNLLQLVNRLAAS